MKKLKFKFDKNAIIAIISILIICILIGTIIYIHNLKDKYAVAVNNSYNMAFYELVDYVQNVETYLAKASISTSPEHGAETLTNVWREASLAQSCLAQLPLTSSEVGNASKFLNQVSDYSYSLSRKNISGQSLTDEDLKNINDLHTYCVELENILNQLSTDIDNGRIKWNELKGTDTMKYATQVSSIATDTFSSLEKNFHEYSGLIYDGAFSEHILSTDRKGLTGEDIDDGKAKEIATKYYGQDRIETIDSITYSENAEIPSYDLIIKLKNMNEKANISISKKGGHVVFANYNKEVMAETITPEKANELAIAFLNNWGYIGMQETYYLKENGIMTINYAFTEQSKIGEVVVYPDLIKVKIALDSGEITGIETSNYLNCHENRTILSAIITKDDARKIINKNLQIQSENLAIIPTKWKTEVLCWEFKGKVGEKDFIVYVNAETGKEQDILMIVNTPNGTLTH